MAWTLEQQRSAAMAGRAMRTARARLRILLKQRQVTLAGALNEPAAAGVALERLLEWLPGVGTARQRRILEDVGVSGTRMVGDLTEPERTALLSRDW